MIVPLLCEVEAWGSRVRGVSGTYENPILIPPHELGFSVASGTVVTLGLYLAWGASGKQAAAVVPL